MFNAANIPPLHDFQEAGVGVALDALLSRNGRKAPLMLVSPTGTGKTVGQVALLNRAAALGLRGLQVAPSMEILAGFARWAGVPRDRAALEANGFYTPRRLLNRLGDGLFDPNDWDFVQIDESHHSVDLTHQTIDQYLGHKPRLGWTATDFRGTPQETAKLRVWWGDNVYRLIGEEEAARRGFMAAPSVEVLPLVDDELISVSKGEFSTVGLEAATEDKLEELVSWAGKFFDPATGLWDRPTMLALPTAFLVSRAMDWFRHFGLPAVAVLGQDPRQPGTGLRGVSLRQRDFEDLTARRVLLVQIRVVGEGVDLPIRRVIDASPTMSPVLWRQRIGRGMRPVAPGEAPPEYIVTNHNLMRHGYLLHGVLPPAVFRQARQAWGENFRPSKRMVARASGLEGLGRFVPNEIPLADGSFWWMFALATPDGRKHYAALIDPAGGESVYAVREFNLDESDGTRRKRYEDNPTWRRIKALPELAGCTSVPAPPLTPGMARWWKNAAAGKGLDKEADINGRIFSILPLLTDIGGKFRKGGLR